MLIENFNVEAPTEKLLFKARCVKAVICGAWAVFTARNFQREKKRKNSVEGVTIFLDK